MYLTVVLSLQIHSHVFNSAWVLVFCFLSDSQPQAQVQDEEITEDDLRLIEERESSIRQLEVSIGGFMAEHVFDVPKKQHF